jgi:hypothetical protein
MQANRPFLCADDHAYSPLIARESRRLRQILHRAGIRRPLPAIAAGKPSADITADIAARYPKRNLSFCRF